MTAFPLSWSHYVLLTRRCRSDEARQFYHAEALRGGWSVRQLQRQIDSQFYERMALSKDKSSMPWKDWPARFWPRNTAPRFLTRADWQRRLKKPGGYWMRERSEKREMVND
jgi:predicted nuclease of restriction endonuclease-like (RecB) superfamily